MRVNLQTDYWEIPSLTWASRTIALYASVQKRLGPSALDLSETYSFSLEFKQLKQNKFGGWIGDVWQTLIVYLCLTLSMPIANVQNNLGCSVEVILSLCVRLRAVICPAAGCPPYSPVISASPSLRASQYDDQELTKWLWSTFFNSSTFFWVRGFSNVLPLAHECTFDSYLFFFFPFSLNSSVCYAFIWVFFFFYFSILCISSCASFCCCDTSVSLRGINKVCLSPLVLLYWGAKITKKIHVISVGHVFLFHYLQSPSVDSHRYLIGFLHISSVCCYWKKPLCPSTLLMSALPLERSEPSAPCF